MRAMAGHVDAEHALADSTTLRERAAELHRQANTLRHMVTSGAEAVNAE